VVVKIRFGVGLGADTAPADLGPLVDRLETARIDSLWFSELVSTRAVDPFIGMAFALARTEKLKVGTSVAILPGRHPVLVAKQLASLAALGPKRVLPAFGLAPAIPGERDVFAVPDGRRGEVFDESLQLLRAVLDAGGEPVAFDGHHVTVRAAAVAPRPEPPLDIWLGGSAPGALRRIGRLADGWLGSFLTPGEAAAAVGQINAAATEYGRTIEPDHFGVSLAVCAGSIPDELAAVCRRRRPDADPAELVAADWAALHRQLDGYLEAGLTKFVIRPSGGQELSTFVEEFATELLPRQN
jgi:probable F420-dependent oxidoreductase